MHLEVNLLWTESHTLQTCSLIPGGTEPSSEWEGVRVEHGWLLFKVGEEDEQKQVKSLLHREPLEALTERRAREKGE